MLKDLSDQKVQNDTIEAGSLGSNYNTSCWFTLVSDVAVTFPLLLVVYRKYHISKPVGLASARCPGCLESAK